MAADGDRAELVERFREESSRGDRVRLEGFHALKHALRFGGTVENVLCSDPDGLEELARELAPDLEERVRSLARVVDAESFRALGGYAHHTRVVAVAHRPEFDAVRAIGDPAAPVVVLEDPRHAGNLGAVVRVAAAGEASAVLTSGGSDPWDPAAVRGSGGLHFALPVGAIEGLDVVTSSGRPILALDPEGQPFAPDRVPADAVLAFGSERHGLSDDLLAAADVRLRLPMRAGVSSLNLATSVAAVLYAWRLSAMGN